MDEVEQHQQLPVLGHSDTRQYPVGPSALLVLCFPICTQVRHVLFTEPEVVQAGQTVTMYYNPQDTPLNGHDKVRQKLQPMVDQTTALDTSPKPDCCCNAKLLIAPQTLQLGS
jgi:hypothetical protein